MRPMQPTAVQLGLEDLGTPLIDTTFVVLDLETTGLSAATDRITEIGAVKVRGGEVLGELRTFVHPGRPVPPAVTAVTGITDAMLRGAPSIGAVLPSVLTFLGDDVLVAHNAAFDVAFLRAACHEHHATFEPMVLDTARLARRLLRDEVRNVRLSTLAQHLRARTRPEHRALADARATVDVLHGLIERAAAYGATTLEDLRDLAVSTSEVAFRRIGMVADAPRRPGVYRFIDARDEILYVGKATDLRARLRTYFGQDRRRRIADLVRETERVEWTCTATLLHAEVVEVRTIHAARPRYNRRSTRPESAVHVALTDEAFPRLSIVRTPTPKHLRTLGPLPSRRVAQRLIEAVHEVVPLRTCTPRLRRRQDHPACMLKDLGRCGAPCDGTQSPADYAEVVATTLGAFDDPTMLLAGIRRRMTLRAEQGRFEHAQELRDRLHTTAHAFITARERATIAGIDELVLVRRDGTGVEVVVVRRGRLAGALQLDDDPSDEDVMARLQGAALEPCPGPPRGQDAEEISLILAWTKRPGVHLLHASSGWTSSLAGGRALADARLEARAVASQVRRDRQLLAGAKVSQRSRVA